MSIHWFTAQAVESIGDVGWLMDNQPDFMPLGGVGTAHDLLEHVPTARHYHETAQEALAQGAAIYIRIEDNRYSFLTNRGALRRPQEDIAYAPFDVIYTRQLMDSDVMSYSLPPCPRRRILPLIAEASAEYHRVLQWEEHEGLDMPEWDLVARWMTEGYYRAKHRYRHRDPYDVCRFFCALATQFDRWLKTVETPGEAKPRMRVDIQPTKLRAKLEFWPKGHWDTEPGADQHDIEYMRDSARRVEIIV